MRATTSPGAQTDIAPPHILRAALGARVPPHTILNVRYELLESARVAALRFTLPPKIMEQIPKAHSAWGEHGGAPLAGVRGGMGGGSWAIVRMQAALERWEGLHSLAREANADAAVAARMVLPRSSP